MDGKERKMVMTCYKFLPLASKKKMETGREEEVEDGKKKWGRR